MTTRSAPRRTEVRATSMATLPPPTTVTAEAAEVGRVVVAHVAQELDGGHHALGVLARKPELLVGVRADGKVDGVVLRAQAVHLLAVHAVVELDVDSAVENPLDLGVELLARQAVVGDAVAQHAAEVRALLEDRDLVPHEGEVVGAREARRAAADHADALAGGGLDVGPVSRPRAPRRSA